MESKKIVEDFSNVLSKSNTPFSVVHNISILHLEKENITLQNILETIACANTTKIINNKIITNQDKIRQLKFISQNLIQ